MEKKIEISIFKILILIFGILSFVFPWVSINIRISYNSLNLFRGGEFNFIGGLIKHSYSSYDYLVNYMNILTLFGVLYLIGFLLILLNVTINKIEKLGKFEKIGLFIIFIAIIVYVIGFLGLISRDLDQYFYMVFMAKEIGADISTTFLFGYGFYLAITTACLVILDLHYKNRFYFGINIIEKIEISKFKVLILIFGILSFIFPWVSISYSLHDMNSPLIYFFKDYYNFIGDLITQLGNSVIYETLGKIEINILTLFGLLYLIGLILTFLNLKIGNSDKLKIFGKIGLFIILIAIIGYVIIFIQIIFPERERWRFLQPKIPERGYGPGTILFNIGFYFAIVTIFLIILELCLKKQDYFKIKLSQ